MRDLRQAAKQALLVLRSLPPTDKTSIYSKAEYALEAALEAESVVKQSLTTEPIAWMFTSKFSGTQRHITRFQDELTTYKADKVWPLYINPPEKQPLTDDELKAFIEDKYKKTIFMPCAADKFSLGWYKKGFRDGESYTKEKA